MTTETIKVFWVPGCSACVKTKEFLTGLGVPFEPVNPLASEEAAAELASFGVRSLPIVTRGKEFIFAQSLDQVAEFVGKSNDSEASRLAPEVLVQRWEDLLTIGQSLVADLPAEKLDYLPIPPRPRTMRELSYHIFQIPDVYVRNVNGEFEDWAHFVNLPVPDGMVTNEDILVFARGATARMKDWWDTLEQKDCRFLVNTHYGARTCWELLERQTWHSAQHVRQLQSVFEEFDIPMTRKATPEIYENLPLPEALWQ